MKITRTINYCDVTAKVYNEQEDAIETVTKTVITERKLTDKEMKKEIEKDGSYTCLKVLETMYHSSLYEMEVETFLQYATYAGEGRKVIE